MKKSFVSMIFVCTAILMFTVGCSFSFSTANFNEVFMARDAGGELEQVESYAQDEIFLCVADLANAPDDTVVTAAWYAVDAQDVEPNFLIDQVDITSGSNQLFFDLSNDSFWPVGTYRVDLSINNEFSQSIEFLVK
jgi:hypothetical protein